MSAPVPPPNAVPPAPADPAERDRIAKLKDWFEHRTNVACTEPLVPTTEGLVPITEAFVAIITGMQQQFMQFMDELPWILGNSRASDRVSLYNPTSALPLTEPNPRNREELFNFTVSQCIASAESLGLPSLPQDTPVHERRRQIAGRLGVIIG